MKKRKPKDGMDLMADQARFYKLIRLLCEGCYLQVTMSYDEGKWTFYFDHHLDCQEDPELPPNYKCEGEKPNEALFKAIPTLIKYFKKLKKIRRKQREDECVNWCSEAIVSLEKFYKLWTILYL